MEQERNLYIHFTMQSVDGSTKKNASSYCVSRDLVLYSTFLSLCLTIDSSNLKENWMVLAIIRW